MSPKSKPPSSSDLPTTKDNESLGPANVEPDQTAPAPMIECPPELGPSARREWDRIVGHLTATGALSIFDRGPLAIYCAAYGYYLEATEALQKYGTMMKSPTGYPVQSPYVAIANRQADLMLRIALEFGFTPASRGRLWMVASSDSKLLELEDLDSANAKW